MRNPLRSEAEMFRFLIGAIVYFGLIVLASLAGGTWWGVGVFVVLSIPVALWFTGRLGPERGARLAPAAPATTGERRVLVLAPPGARPHGLREQLTRNGAVDEVVVVVPALATPVEQVTGDVDDRRADAQRLAESLAGELSGAGLRARAEVGADDPIQAIEDSLRLFGASELVIAGGDESLLARARERFAMPIAAA